MDPAWWRAFNDPILTELEERVARSNLDVRLATVRLQESRLQRGVTAADEFPNLNGNASYTREKISDRGVIGMLGGSRAPAAAAAPARAPPPVRTGWAERRAVSRRARSAAARPAAGPLICRRSTCSRPGFDSSWEIDFWGRVRREVESADAAIDASAEARRDMLVTVLAELARDYIQLRGQQRDLQIARDTLASERDSLRITQERQSGGLTTGLDVANASAQVGTTAAQIPQLEAQAATTMNAIGLLLGETPGALVGPAGAGQAGAAGAARRAGRLAVRTRPPPPGYPSARRPSCMPRPPISARRRPISFRRSRCPAASACRRCGSRIWATSARSAPCSSPAGLRSPSRSSRAARLKYTLDLRKAQQQEAAVQYQQVVLQAFHDVDNALTNYAPNSFAASNWPARLIRPAMRCRWPGSNT